MSTFDAAAGLISRKITTVTGAYTATVSDSVLYVTGTGTITLPSASLDNLEIEIEVYTYNATATVVASGTDVIFGSGSAVLASVTVGVYSYRKFFLIEEGKWAAG